VSLARCTALGRTAVVRDGYTKNLRDVAEPEGPSRLVLQLRKALRGLCAARGRTAPGPTELRIVAQIARDSIPRLRRSILEALVELGASTHEEVASHIHMPRTTVYYKLEELTALGIAECEGRLYYFLAESFRRLAERSHFLGVHAGTPNHDS